MSFLCFAILLQTFYSDVIFAYDHPGGMHSKAQIEYVKRKIGEQKEPFFAAFKQLIIMADSALLKEHHATPDFAVPGYYQDAIRHRINSRSLQSDAFNAYTCALAWQLTRQDKYAQKSVYFINAWSTINIKCSDLDGPLAMANSGSALVMAAELMTGYKDWKNEKMKLFDIWLETVYKNASKSLLSRKDNLGDWGKFGLILSAYFQNDNKVIDSMIINLKSAIRSKIAEDGHMVEEVMRGTNGIWYSYFSLAPLTASCWIVYSATGENLFLYEIDNKSIKKALDYLLYYNQNPGKWVWCNNPIQGLPEANYTTFKFWPGNLIEAMSGIYEDTAYFSYISVYRPVCYAKHHFAWVYPTLLPNRLDGYK